MSGGPAFAWIRRPERGRFLERLNRFACLVELQGRPTKVYLPNSGRLEDLLRPGAPVLVEARRTSGKTRHDLLLIQAPGYPQGRPVWAGLDSRLPPRLVGWLAARGELPGLEGAAAVRAEPRLGEGRADLALRTPQGEHLVETKSVNLLDREGVARFPDAPTRRGRRHLEALARLEGPGRWVVFAVLREDARAFSPFAERDPDFTRGLLAARAAGVRVLALKFAMGPEVRYLGPLPVLLPPPPFPGFWPEAPPST